MRNISLYIFLLAVTFAFPVFAQEPLYKVTFEESTPLGFGVSFLIEDEGYTLENESTLNSIGVTGTFTGESVEEAVTAIANSVGYSVQISGTNIVLVP